MMYRSPTATACQLPQSLPAATELSSCHRACQPPQSLPAATEPCQPYTAHQLPHSSLKAYSLLATTQLANSYFSSFPQLLPSLCGSYQAAPPQSSFPTTTMTWWL